MSSRIGQSKKSNRRFELKYRINIMQYNKLKIILKTYLKEDYFTATSEEKRYYVRSLYYDTYDYAIYHEKMSGDSERIKFRLRTYSKEVSQAIVRVEMKVRMAETLEKLGVLVSLEEYQYFLRNGHWPDTKSPILKEFQRYLYLRSLKPQILVEYEREGYEDRNKEGIRVTFDHKVRSAHADELFPERKLFYQLHHPHWVILEIKCRDKQPLWLRDIVRNYGLKLVANSKFAQGTQAARQDLYYPGGVVVIR